jgi:AcrR family transcriptional regulator
MRDRRPSRPRSPRVHRAILDATVALFVQAGFDGMSVEAVAATAGVGKSAIYRRWPAKEDLVIAAIADAFDEPASPDTGSVRADLLLSARELHRLMTSAVTGGVFPPMAGEVAKGSRLGCDYAERVIGPRRAIFAAAVRRGIERGELAAGADVELGVDLLVGTFLLRRLTGRLLPPDPTLPERVVDLALAGLRQPPAAARR